MILPSQRAFAKGSQQKSAAEELGMRTPISVATEQSRHEVLELLLIAQVDMERKEPDDYNLVLVPCAHGFLKCVMSSFCNGWEAIGVT